MRTITQEELNKIVEQHQHWIKEDCEGWEDMRANLEGANLEGANFNLMYNVECVSGFHFFRTRKEAEEY